jgi:acetyl esterase/lipase
VAAATLTASLLTSCSPATVLGWVQPAAAGGEIRDIAYAPGPRHTLDIYLPPRADPSPPIVVFFYGGGWTSGDKAMYRFVGRVLASCGALAIVPDYRVWPDAGFRGFLQDAAAAVGFAREEAARRGGDPGKLFLMGHSAGAYIAAMLALDPQWLAGVGMDARRALAGVVGLAGPYDFLPLRDPVLERIFAPVGPRTQPISFAANASAPLLLASGADDRTVDPANSTRLAARVRGSGGQARVIVYPGIRHTTLLGAFAAPLRFLAPVRQDVCAFLNQWSPATARVTAESAAAR